MRELPYGFKTYKNHWRPGHCALKPLERHAGISDQIDLDVLDILIGWMSGKKEDLSEMSQAMLQIMPKFK